MGGIATLSDLPISSRGGRRLALKWFLRVSPSHLEKSYHEHPSRVRVYGINDAGNGQGVSMAPRK